MSYLLALGFIGLVSSLHISVAIITGQTAYYPHAYEAVCAEYQCTTQCSPPRDCGMQSDWGNELLAQASRRSAGGTIIKIAANARVNPELKALTATSDIVFISPLERMVVVCLVTQELRYVLRN